MEAPNRQLSAIFFADIQGYTSLMQKNESFALKLLQHFESTLHREVENSKGEVIKLYGDGCLVMFDSAVRAVKCAQNIQRELQNEPVVPLRIGIHIGDVVRKGQDVFGNGVNIASRIESMGVPNSILISDNVYKEISNHPEIRALDLGRFRFKNVSDAFSLYAIDSEGLQIPSLSEMKGKGRLEKPSKFRLIPFAVIALVALAVFLWRYSTQKTMRSVGQEAEEKLTVVALPFDIRGNDDIQYFEEGMMDLISSGIDGLLSINSLDPQIVMAHLDDQDARFDDVINNKIWDKYGIDYFITGSMLDLGNQYKLVSTLFDRTGNKASVFESSLDDLGQIQNGIDQLIKEHTTLILEIEKLPEETAVLQVDLDVPTLRSYLEAEANYRSGNYRQAIDLYERVIEADSTFALAYLGLANSFLSSNRTPSGVQLALTNIAKAYENRNGVHRPIQNIIEAKYALCITGDFRSGIYQMERTLREYGPNINLYKELGVAKASMNFIDNKPIAESRKYFEEAMAYDSSFMEVIAFYVPILVRANEMSLAKQILERVSEHSSLYLISQSWLYFFQDSSQLTRESFLDFNEKHGAYPNSGNLKYMSFDWYKKIDDFEDVMIQSIPNLTEDRRFKFQVQVKKVVRGQFSNFPFPIDWGYQYSFLDHSFHPFTEQQTDSLINQFEIHAKKMIPKNAYYYANKALLTAHAQGVSAFNSSIDTVRSRMQYRRFKELIQENAVKQSMGIQHIENLGRVHLHYNYHKLQLSKYKYLSEYEKTIAHVDSLFQKLTFNYTHSTTWQFYYAPKYVEAEARRLSKDYRTAIQIYQLLLELPDRYYYGPVHLRLAQCHDALGEYKTATDYYTRFLYIYSECDDFWQHNVEFAITRREELMKLLG